MPHHNSRKSFSMFKNKIIVIKGAGDLASGIAVRLKRSGFPIIMTEIAQPLTIRRTISFSDAVYTGKTQVEEIIARGVISKAVALKVMGDGDIPIMVDPEADIVNEIHPFAVIDAIMAKKNTGTRFSDAPLVIGLGPGFEAGKDVHAVIETKRGHKLGSVIWDGPAFPNTGIPGNIKGVRADRIIRSPGPGIFKGVVQIGKFVHQGEIVAYAGTIPIKALISGTLRGLLHDGIWVTKNFKAGDIDPRGMHSHCHSVSDKAFSLGGGVLEALLMTMNKRCTS